MPAPITPPTVSIAGRPRPRPGRHLFGRHHAEAHDRRVRRTHRHDLRAPASRNRLGANTPTAVNDDAPVVADTTSHRRPRRSASNANGRDSTMSSRTAASAMCVGALVHAELLGRVRDGLGQQRDAVDERHGQRGKPHQARSTATVDDVGGQPERRAFVGLDAAEVASERWSEDRFDEGTDTSARGSPTTARSRSPVTTATISWDGFRWTPTKLSGRTGAARADGRIH